MRKFSSSHQRKQRAYTLIELLVCLVIIALLTSISLVYYAGALDQGDLKYAAPAVAGRLEAMRREATEKNRIIKVEIKLDSPEWTVTRREGTKVETETENLDEERLIKRKLRFRRYEWPDGADTPATFTFFPNAKPQGGKVIFGTALAEAAILLHHDRIYCDLGSRDSRKQTP